MPTTPPSDHDPLKQAEQAIALVIAALPDTLPPNLALDVLLSSYLSMAQSLGNLQKVGVLMCTVGPVLRRGGSQDEAQAALMAAVSGVSVTLLQQGAELPPAHEASREKVASLAGMLSNALPTDSSDAEVICAALTFLCAAAATSERNRLMASSLMQAGANELLLGGNFDRPNAARPVSATTSVH